MLRYAGIIQRNIRMETRVHITSGINFPPYPQLTIPSIFVHSVDATIPNGNTMNISLTTELELYVTTQVQSGLYHSASELIREALRDQIRCTASQSGEQHISTRRQQLANGHLSLADSNYFAGKREKIRQQYGIKEPDEI